MFWYFFRRFLLRLLIALVAAAVLVALAETVEWMIFGSCVELGPPLFMVYGVCVVCCLIVWWVISYFDPYI